MIMEKISRYVFYPLWDIWDKSSKLKVLGKMQKSQWNSLSIIKKNQWKSLKSTLMYAEKFSPYYKNLFENNNINLDEIKSYKDIEKIPVTTKIDVRNNLNTFISDEYKIDELINAKTGGSTGVSLNLYFDDLCEQNRNSAAMRSDMWAGWKAGAKRAALWGNPPTPKTIKEKIRHHCLDRTIFLDTMSLDDLSMSNFVRQWRKEKPKAVFGHAHSIFIFAQYLNKNKEFDLRPEAIVATSMMLLEHERIVIEQVFSCRVTNRYGCEEVGLIASECEQHQGMHLNIEHLYIEFLDDNGKPVPTGEPGKITLTDFNNKGMPLIRYQVGDIGVATDRMCECGRGLPLMEHLEGRVADFLLTHSGALVSGISLIERTLTNIPGIEQMQLIQKNINELIINRVKALEYSVETDKRLIEEFTVVFGEEVKYVITDVNSIPQEKSGKYRFSICEIN
ncbi:MAG: phenylacetate-CoA ligase [bacterium]|jgi:phenylacetate-CoA ligase